MSGSNGSTAQRIILYTCGIGLILAAIIILLKGLGVLSAIPSFVIWALVLVAIGAGILGGISRS